MALPEREFCASRTIVAVWDFIYRWHNDPKYKDRFPELPEQLSPPSIYPKNLTMKELIKLKTRPDAFRRATPMIEHKPMWAFTTNDQGPANPYSPHIVYPYTSDIIYRPQLIQHVAEKVRMSYDELYVELCYSAIGKILSHLYMMHLYTEAQAARDKSDYFSDASSAKLIDIRRKHTVSEFVHKWQYQIFASYIDYTTTLTPRQDHRDEDMDMMSDIYDAAKYVMGKSMLAKAMAEGKGDTILLTNAVNTREEELRKKGEIEWSESRIIIT